MAIRNYSSVAPETTLTGGISNIDTVMIVASSLGLPAPPFTMAVDYGASTEELVDVTNVAGTSLTITRAVDGTSATNHGAGAKVRHVSSARDFREANTHVNSSTDVHGTGVGSAVVGTTTTQTLTNKTLTSPTINTPTISTANLTGTTTATTINANAVNAAGSITVGTSPSFAGTATVNGSLSVQNGAEVSATGGTATHLEVEKGLGTTGLLQRWSSVGGTNTLAYVDGNGEFDSTSFAISGAGGFTAAAGWSLAAFRGVIKGGYGTWSVSLTRTGAPIVANSSGNIADTLIGTIGPDFAPNPLHQAGPNLVSTYISSQADGAVTVNPSSSAVTIVTLSPNATIATSEVITATFCYTVGPI